jgi:hypothetical protein
MRDKGKAFEDAFRKSCEKYLDISIDRVNDNMSGYLGVDGICDFIVYRKPYECYVECKSHNGNILPFACIIPKKKESTRKRQQKSKFERMLDKSKIDGVTAGYLIWLIDKDVTFFLDVRDLEYARSQGYKSIGYHNDRVFSFPENTSDRSFEVTGKRKRVYYNYDMDDFFKKVGEVNGRGESEKEV